MKKLPDNWCEVALGEISSTSSGIGFPLQFQGRIEGELGFYKVGDISRAVIEQGGFLKNPQHCVSKEIAAELKGKPIPSGATVFAKIGEAVKLNRRAFVVDECLVDNNVMAVKAFQSDSDRYIYMFLRTRDFTDLSRATTVPSLRKGDIESLIIPLAPLNEQNRIADKLDSILARIDACRERLDRIPTILKRFRQAVLAAATSGKLTEEWRKEKEIEQKWTATDIQSIAKVGTGSTPLRSNFHFYSADGTPWITSSATANPFVYSAEEFVTEAAIAAHRLKIYPIGTFLVAMYGEGKTRGQVTELRIAATINQACAAIVVNKVLVDRAFIKLVLQANYLKMRFLAEGGNQPNLNLSKIKKFPLLLPDLQEQTEIARRVEELFAYADRIEARYHAARARIDKLTPAILAKAFRGELVPQNPDDEPASVLLDRIRASRAKIEATLKPKRSRNKAISATDRN